MVKKKENKNYFLMYVIGLSILVFTIVLIRAAITEVTWDEAFTYVNYVRRFDFNRQFINITTNYANNHILNTLLISFFDNICNIPYNELIIRLPNLIMFAIYLIVCYFFAKDKKHKYLLFTGLSLNYYVTEFFGLARGYGLATGLIMIMLYFVNKAHQNNYDSKNILLSMLFGVLACYANTVSIFAIGAVGLLYFIQLFKKKEIWKFIKKNIIPIILLLILFSYIVMFHFLVTGNGKPLFGNATIVEFFKHNFIWMFIQNDQVNIIGSILLFLIIVASAIVYRKKIIEKPFFSILVIFLLFLLLVPAVLCKPFLVERCLIPFWPLFMIGLIEIYELFEEKVPKVIIKITSLGLIVLFMISFGVKIDVTKTRDWYTNYQVRDRMYRALYTKQRIVNEEKEELTKYYGYAFYRDKILKSYGYNVIP